MYHRAYAKFIGVPLGPAKARGLGLPMAIFIITVMAFVAVAINQLGEDNARITGVNALSMRAFYAAESGANLALNALFPPVGTPDACAVGLVNRNFTQAGLSQCNVVVDCALKTAPGITTYELISTGTCGSGSEAATRVVRVVAE